MRKEGFMVGWTTCLIALSVAFFGPLFYPPLGYLDLGILTVLRILAVILFVGMGLHSVKSVARFTYYVEDRIFYFKLARHRRRRYNRFRSNIKNGYTDDFETRAKRTIK